MKLLDVSTVRNPNIYIKLDDEMYDWLQKIQTKAGQPRKWYGGMRGGTVTSVKLSVHYNKINAAINLNWLVHNYITKNQPIDPTDIEDLIFNCRPDNSGDIIGFKNEDIYDYQSDNLVVTTRHHNHIHNQNTSSEFKGVSYVERTGLWRTDIRDEIETEGKTKILGNYIDEEDAARAYDKQLMEWGMEPFNFTEVMTI